MSASKANKTGTEAAADMSGYRVKHLFDSPSEQVYEVANLDSWATYYVRLEKKEFWVCTCPQHVYRGGHCKHIELVKREYVEVEADGSNYDFDLDEWEDSRARAFDALCAAGYEELVAGMDGELGKVEEAPAVDFMPDSHGEPFPVGMTIDVTCPF